MNGLRVTLPQPEFPVGTTDKTTYEFHCPKCRSKETLTVYEKGSNWGASWEEPPESERFTIEWKRNQFNEPKPILAQCIACHIAATHEIS